MPVKKQMIGGGIQHTTCSYMVKTNNYILFCIVCKWIFYVQFIYPKWAIYHKSAINFFLDSTLTTHKKRIKNPYGSILGYWRAFLTFFKNLPWKSENYFFDIFFHKYTLKWCNYHIHPTLYKFTSIIVGQNIK